MAGDVIEVRKRILEIREKVIRFLHEMMNAETQEIAATCELCWTESIKKHHNDADP